MVVNKKKIVTKIKSKDTWEVTKDKKFRLGENEYQISLHPEFSAGNYDKTFLIDYGAFRRRIYCKKCKKTKNVGLLFIACRGLKVSYNGEYYTILKERILLPVSQDDKYFKLENFLDKKKKEFANYDAQICYDIETCDNDFGKHELYLAFFLVFDSGYNMIQEQLIEYENDFFDFEHSFNAFIKDVIRKIAEDKIAKGLLPLVKINIFGFNTFRFDNHFIYDYFSKQKYDIQYHERFGKTIVATMTFNNVTIELNDLVGWLPEFTLKDALKAYECISKDELNIVLFNEQFKKIRDINYWKACTQNEFYGCFEGLNIVQKMSLSKKYKKDNKFNLWQAVVDYCKQDVYSTFDIYKKIQMAFSNIHAEFHEVLFSPDIFAYISPSHASGIIMTSYLDSQTKRIKFTNKDWFDFIKETYYGGRVDFGFVGEHFNEKKITCMDVTSMYPLAMTAKYPITQKSKDVMIGSNHEIIQKIVDMDRCFDILFIAACKLTMPEDKTKLCSFPPLPGRDGDGKLNFINRDYDCKVLNSIHIATAKLSGYTITILDHKYNTVFGKAGTIFEKMVKDFGEKKTAAKDDNKALAKLYKLLMNSWQGKLAQKTLCKYWKYDSAKQTNFIFEEDNIGASKVYYASFITAYANYILFSTFYQIQQPYIELKIPIEERLGSLIYCDTDSIFFTFYNDTPNFIFNQTESLGYFDVDKKEFIVTWKQKMHNCNAMIIFGKKSYYCFHRDQNGKNIPIDIHLKGIHMKQMAQFTYDVMMDIIKDNAKTITFNGLTRKTTQKITNFNSNNNNFITKEIYSSVLKKTLKVNIPPSKKLIAIVNGTRYFY